MRPEEGIEPRYLQFFMHARRFVNSASADTSATDRELTSIRLPKFKFPSPHPPNSASSWRGSTNCSPRCRGEAVLKRTSDDLDTWRRALLKAAVTGELTREWRENTRSNETGLDVLARVAKARIGYKTTKARGRKVIVEELEEDALPEIPKTWAWSCLGDLGDIVGGATVYKKRRPADPVTLPYLRVANVQRGRLDLDEIKSITVERSTAVSLRLEPGDILLNEGGDLDKIGRGWIWNGEIDNCIHQNHIFRVRLFERSLSSYFISHYANEMGRRFFVEKGKQTTNLASISLSKISQLPIPVPPIAEMNEAMRLLATPSRCGGRARERARGSIRFQGCAPIHPQSRL